MNWSGFSFCDIIHPFVLPTRVCVVINSLLTFYKKHCLSSLTAPRDCIFHSNIKSSMNGLSKNQKRYCRTKLTTNFFGFRTVNMWNGLPDDVLSPTWTVWTVSREELIVIAIFWYFWLCDCLLMRWKWLDQSKGQQWPTSTSTTTWWWWQSTAEITTLVHSNVDIIHHHSIVSPVKLAQQAKNSLYQLHCRRLVNQCHTTLNSVLSSCIHGWLGDREHAQTCVPLNGHTACTHKHHTSAPWSLLQWLVSLWTNVVHDLE